MPDPTPRANRRILIIDDNASIHLDFRKVLGAQAEHTAQAALDELEANLFGEAVVAAARPNFDIDSAYQGQEGVAMVHQALAAQELGGSLLVTSDGPGCGATFILELPCSPPESVRG